MNQTMETIKNRRSVRQYRSEQIKDQELEEILEAAIYAPTGHNDQPWHFTIIQNIDMINEINDGAKKVMQKMEIEWISKLGAVENFNIFHRAPTVLIVSGRNDATSPLVDCSAAVENILLAAESMYIGSCWIGFARFFFMNPGSKKKLNIPKDYEVHFGVSLGYKVRENPQAPERNQNVYTYFK
ncbi:MAG TPA: nitroreductase family protein [Methanobacterium sp.]